MRSIICPINIIAKAKATKYSRGINFTLISVATVTGMHGTELPNKSSNQIGKQMKENSPKIVFMTFLGHVLDIFCTFWGHGSLLLGCPMNDFACCKKKQSAVFHIVLASPSGTLVLSFFGGCPVHEEKEFHCPQGGSEGLFRKTTLVWALHFQRLQNRYEIQRKNLWIFHPGGC